MAQDRRVTSVQDAMALKTKDEARECEECSSATEKVHETGFPRAFREVRPCQQAGFGSGSWICLQISRAEWHSSLARLLSSVEYLPLCTQGYHQVHAADAKGWGKWVVPSSQALKVPLPCCCGTCAESGHAQSRQAYEGD